MDFSFVVLHHAFPNNGHDSGVQGTQDNIAASGLPEAAMLWEILEGKRAQSCKYLISTPISHV